jgi:hypothetical protein
MPRDGLGIIRRRLVVRHRETVTAGTSFRVFALKTERLSVIIIIIKRLVFRRTNNNNKFMLDCLRCGAEWESRKKSGLPVQCPRCKRVDWNRDGQNGTHAESHSGVEGQGEERGGQSSTVPVLPKTKGPEKRLRPVQSVRSELAGRGKSDQGSAERAVSANGGGGKKSAESCRLLGHRVLPSGEQLWCVNCEQFYEANDVPSESARTAALRRFREGKS